MVQHVQIVLNGDNNPVAAQTSINIWRDDQQLEWFFTQEVVEAGWGWDNMLETGAGQAVFFDTKADWPGSTPAPVGIAPTTGSDLRHYTATGPGANPLNTVQTFAYHLAFRNLDGRVFPHDPEVGNQPQP